MAYSNEAAQGVSREQIDVSVKGATEDLLAAVVAGGAPSVLGMSAEVIAHPMGGAMRTTPVGGAKKRIFDVVCAALIIVLAAPLLAFVALATLLLSEGPVLYSHKRVGFRGRDFRCLKFRTMVVDSDRKLAEHLAVNPSAAREWEENRKLRNDPRITWIGHFLRKTSLDELPQLFNVLNGEMSLVGPRPVVTEELSRYGRHRSAYLSVRPGMTGLWQVSGRNSTTYDRRVMLDAAYVRNWRLVRDLKIVFRTVPEMLMSSHTS